MTGPAPRWLLAAILADGLVLGALVGTGFGIFPEGEEIIKWVAGGFAFAIYAGVGGWLWLWPSPRAYGLAMGVSIVGVKISGAWLALLALGLGMSSGPLGGDALGSVGTAVGLLLAQIVLSIAAYYAAGRAGVVSRLEVAGAGVVTLYIVGFLSIPASLVVGIFLESGALHRSVVAFDAKQAAVYRVEGCAAQFADSHPKREYPTTLDAMGPRGSRCLDEHSAAGRDAHGVRIEYNAQRESSGRTASFAVTANKGNPNEPITGDTSGLSRNGNIIFGASLGTLAGARNCLELYRTRFPDRPFPASLVDLARAVGRRREDGRPFPPTALYGGCHMLIDDDPRPLADREAELMNTNDGHRLTYRPEGDSGYVLELRPLAYGESAVRSYRLRRSGGVHLTLLDRAATEDDPQVTRCVYRELYRRDCAFLPGEPPAVIFVHDAVVASGSPYRLAARDPRNRRSPPDTSLRFYFECANPTGLGERTQVQAEITCPPPPDFGRLELNRLAMRLWAVSRSGAVSVYEDTVRVIGDSLQSIP